MRRSKRARALLIGLVGAVPACAGAGGAPSRPPAVELTIAARPADPAPPPPPSEDAPPPRPHPEALTWEASGPDAVAKAVAKARTEGRPMLVDFYAEWCMACKQMAKETFSDPRVQRSGARFVAVRVDATDDEGPGVKEILERYDVAGLPTLLLIDASGRERQRLTEFVGPDAFLGALREIR